MFSKYVEIKILLLLIMDNIDWQRYLNENEDIKKHFYYCKIENAKYHYLKFGKNEKRPIYKIKNYKTNFDWKFYLNMYPDLKQNNINDEISALQHYEMHGKKEGRAPNNKYLEKNYYSNLKIMLNNFKNICLSNKNQNLINILVRTTKNRSEYLNICLNSILNQKYQNYLIYIHYDHDDCLQYLTKLNNNKIHYFNSKLNNNNKYKYNLYCNFLLDKVKNGFIMFLDDDDCLTHNKVLNIINDNLEENKILKWNFLRPDKIIYSEK